MTHAQGRIVVGVDGSPASLEALRWAVGQAALTGAAVEAVTAWEYPADYGAADYGAAPMSSGIDWQANAREALETALGQAVAADAPAIMRTVQQGHPAKVLLNASAGAELLVVGNRGHGGFAGLLLGSVSDHVVAHAACPVLVIRHP